MRSQIANCRIAAAHLAREHDAICPDISGQSETWEMRKVRGDGSALWGEETDGSRLP
jgi:hypothetical protein